MTLRSLSALGTLDSEILLWSLWDFVEDLFILYTKISTIAIATAFTIIINIIWLIGSLRFMCKLLLPKFDVSKLVLVSSFTFNSNQTLIVGECAGLFTRSFLFMPDSDLDILKRDRLLRKASGSSK